MNLKFKRVLHLVPAMYTYSTLKHTTFTYIDIYRDPNVSENILVGVTG